jgi:uncharacterized protein VirK/YbjX
MTIDSINRKSQLSPLKYGFFKSRIAYWIMLVLNLKGVLILSKNHYDQLKYLYKNYPEAIPSVFWPYQCASWGIVKRLESLHSHFDCIDDGLNYLKVSRYGQKEIVCLDEFYTGLRVVMDKKGIFLREGMLVLSIALRDERLFSIAFSLNRSKSNNITAAIGAIQGRRMNEVTEIYREITKKFYGIRPRDLMVELFQMFCRILNVEKILAVKESERQHHHYFYMLKNKSEVVSLDYDEVWKERGGRCCFNEYYELPIHPVRKPYHMIIAKKRSMYRKRYELLASIEQKMALAISNN